jgi:hypothetical protein
MLNVSTTAGGAASTKYYGGWHDAAAAVAAALIGTVIRSKRRLGTAAVDMQTANGSESTCQIQQHAKLQHDAVFHLSH